MNICNFSKTRDPKRTHYFRRRTLVCVQVLQLMWSSGNNLIIEIAWKKHFPAQCIGTTVRVISSGPRYFTVLIIAIINTKHF